MNKRTQRKYLIEWKSTHFKYERWISPYFKKALDTQIKAVIESVEDQGVFLIQGFLPQLIKPEPMIEAYQKAYERVGIAHGKWTTDWMTDLEDESKSRFSKKQISFGSEFWRRKMREFLLIYGAEKVSEVDSFTVERIRSLLINYNNEGLTMSEQATALVKELSSPSYNRARALRIGRTESTMAANYVTKTAGEEADYQTQKQWLTIMDGRERDSHRFAHEQIRELDEPFNVGGTEMDRPGDPNGGASQVVNCRCTLVILPKFDDNGVPIPK